MWKTIIFVTIMSIEMVNSKSFLYETLMPSPNTTNIVDLRNAKGPHHHLFNESQSDNASNPNEETPGIFQKVVTKILHKVRLLVSLYNYVSTPDNENMSVTEEMSNQDKNNSSKKSDSGEIVELTTLTSIREGRSSTFSLSNIFQSVINLVSRMSWM